LYTRKPPPTNKIKQQTPAATATGTTQAATASSTTLFSVIIASPETGVDDSAEIMVVAVVIELGALVDSDGFAGDGSVAEGAVKVTDTTVVVDGSTADALVGVGAVVVAVVVGVGAVVVNVGAVGLRPAGVGVGAGVGVV
jgi:hypothetical protein